MAVAETLEEMKQPIGEAIGSHIEGLPEDGLDVPEPGSMVEFRRSICKILLQPVTD